MRDILLTMFLFFFISDFYRRIRLVVIRTVAHKEEARRRRKRAWWGGAHRFVVSMREDDDIRCARWGRLRKVAFEFSCFIFVSSFALSLKLCGTTNHIDTHTHTGVNNGNCALVSYCFKIRLFNMFIVMTTITGRLRLHETKWWRAREKKEETKRKQLNG